MILGISPSTHSLGFAVIRKSELVSWGTKPYKGKWNNEKLKKVLFSIDQLIRRYGITEIAIKHANPAVSSKAYTQLIGGINILLESTYISATYYDLSQIKRFFSKHDALTKQDIFRLVWTQYPELASQRYATTLIMDFYHSKLMEAVAVAHLHAAMPTRH